jgi:hypothetical protein
MKNVYNILVRKPEGMRPLGRHRRGCEGNIGMGVCELGWEVVDWIHLGQDVTSGDLL